MVGAVLSPDLMASEATMKPLSAEAVLSEAMVARGGRDAWLRIHSFQAKGTVYFQTPQRPLVGCAKYYQCVATGSPGDAAQYVPV